MNENNKYELVKFIDKEFELEVAVNPKEETIWMSANQMTILFNRKYINNIFKAEELVFNNNLLICIHSMR